MPDLENKTTRENIAKKLNLLHQARQNCIKSESSFKIKQALKHKVSTNSDIIYNTRDLVYYKRKDNLNWKGPASVIGRDEQQMLVKHGSPYMRVHPRNLQLRNNNIFENRFNKKRFNIVNDDCQNVKVLFDNEKMCDSDNMFDNEIICRTVGESDKNENI